MERLYISRFLFALTIWLYVIALGTALTDYARSCALFAAVGLCFIVAHLAKP